MGGDFQLPHNSSPRPSSGYEYGCPTTTDTTAAIVITITPITNAATATNTTTTTHHRCILSFIHPDLAIAMFGQLNP